MCDHGWHLVYFTTAGRHYSVPENRTNVRECAEGRRANTYSGSDINSVSSLSHASTPSTTQVPTVQAHQETGIGRSNEIPPHLNLVRSSHVLTSVSQPKRKFHESQDAASFETSNSQVQFLHEQSPTTRPHNNPQQSATVQGSFAINSQQNATVQGSFANHLGSSVNPVPSRKVSEISIPFTQESSSECSSMLEITPSSLSIPSGNHLQFQSNPSSHNVSEEYILNSPSSHAEIAARPSLHDNMHLVGSLQNQRQWYETSVSSLPAAQHFFGGNFTPAHPRSATATPARPMGRSASQEYYHQPIRPQGHNIRRRHTLTPVDVTSRPLLCTQCCGRLSRVLHHQGRGHQQEFQHLSTCHNNQNLFPQLDGIPGHCSDHTTTAAGMSPLLNHHVCGYRVSQVPVRHPSFNAGVRRGWGDGSSSRSNYSTQESLLQSEHMPLDEDLESCPVNGDAGYINTTLRAHDHPPVHDPGLRNKGEVEKGDITERFSDEQLPLQQQMNNYESSTLTRHTFNNRGEQNGNSAKALNNLKKPLSKRISKIRPKSFSVGNRDTVETSTPRSASENTLTSSTAKTSVEIPPIMRSQGTLS